MLNKTTMTTETKVKEMFIAFLNKEPGIYFDIEGFNQDFDHWLQTAKAKSLIGELSGDWISVETELPGHNQIVDAYDYVNRRCKYDADSNQFHRRTDFCDGDRLMYPYYPNVTHWMPLPQPPKIN